MSRDKNITPLTIDGFHRFVKDTEHGLAIYIKYVVLSASRSTENKKKQKQVMAGTVFSHIMVIKCTHGLHAA